MIVNRCPNIFIYIEKIRERTRKHKIEPKKIVGGWVDGQEEADGW
jgi:hypothetical protein